MAELIHLFPSPTQKESLLAQLEDLRATLDALDAQEPEDMNSDEYEQWGDLHEDLEDQIDEILDLLDEE